MIFPYPQQLQKVAESFTKGNFGLWYNKLIPINNENEACGGDMKKDNAVKYYCQQYQKLTAHRQVLDDLLFAKHLDQSSIISTFKQRGWLTLTVHAQLKSPLALGTGESHPNKISMVFDHTTGLPYVPASSLKGVVRFAHCLGLIDEEIFPDDGTLPTESCEDSKIKEVFGTQKNRGRVVFLDGYPVTTPDLHLDIINPHFSKEYYNDKKPSPPADYLTPVPVNFLTVKKGTEFVFRFLLHKDLSELEDMLIKAIKRSLETEGVGAKTSIGYGLFDIKSWHEPDLINDKKQEIEAEIQQKENDAKRATMSPDELMMEDISQLSDETNQIADIVKKCFDGKYEQGVYIKLKEKLNNLNQWKPTGSKQRKEKIKTRNNKIDTRINE